MGEVGSSNASHGNNNDTNDDDMSHDGEEEYLDTFHRAIPRNLLFQLRYDEFEHLSSQNHESLGPLV
jgi:hypothetical protein